MYLEIKCPLLNDGTLLYIKWITNKDLLNVTWQPGWEGSLGENGYMYMDG